MNFYKVFDQLQIWKLLNSFNKPVGVTDLQENNLMCLINTTTSIFFKLVYLLNYFTPDGRSQSKISKLYQAVLNFKHALAPSELMTTVTVPKLNIFLTMFICRELLTYSCICSGHHLFGVELRLISEDFVNILKMHTMKRKGFGCFYLWANSQNKNK